MKPHTKTYLIQKLRSADLQETVADTDDHFSRSDTPTLSEFISLSTHYTHTR